MKKLILFFMSLWALSACDAPLDEQLPADGRQAQLTVSLAAADGGGQATRSGVQRASVATDDEKKLTAVDILVFNQQGFLLRKSRFTGADITAADGMKVNVNVGICSIYVLANLPAQLLDAVATTADLSRVKVDLASQSNLTTGMVMSGEERKKQIVANRENRCTITLKRVTAKVNLSWSINLPAPLKSSDLKVKRVFILNNFAQSTLTGADDNALTVSERIHGKEGISLPATLPSVYAPYLGQVISNTDRASFYLFENRDPQGDIDAAAYSGSKIVIETLYSANGQSTTYYYPVIINKLTEEATKSPVTRNTAYQITANIKGLSGVLDPFDPVVNRNLEITLEVADWVSIDQSVDFN